MVRQVSRRRKLTQEVLGVHGDRDLEVLEALGGVDCMMNKSSSQ